MKKMVFIITPSLIRDKVRKKTHLYEHTQRGIIRIFFMSIRSFYQESQFIEPELSGKRYREEKRTRK
jgi:hypothetical protein